MCGEDAIFGAGADGSEKEIGWGYWLCKAVAAAIESKRVIPLYCEAYSCLAEDFKSENAQLLKLMDMLFKHLGDRGIHAIDRGGDRGVLYEKYLGGKVARRFVIRLKDRDLIRQGRRKSCRDLAKVLPTPYETVLIVYEEGKEKRRSVQYNALAMKRPGYDHHLFMVVVKGFGMEPMMQLSSSEVNKGQKESIWRIVEYYLARWKCDEAYRYIKQCCNLEDIRAQS